MGSLVVGMIMIRHRALARAGVTGFCIDLSSFLSGIAFLMLGLLEFAGISDFPSWKGIRDPPKPLSPRASLSPAPLPGVAEGLKTRLGLAKSCSRLLFFGSGGLQERSKSHSRGFQQQSSSQAAIRSHFISILTPQNRPRDLKNQ